MKYKWLVLLIIMLPIFSTAETSWVGLTKGYADTLYCSKADGCMVTDATVPSACLVDPYTDAKICFTNGTIDYYADK